MNEGQERLYELLEEVDQICRKHGIVYYVGGGAALGAIRGGGFMPWDDDIDLHMTRDNWHKLIKAMETDLPPDRQFVCTENDDLYRNPLGRYVDKRTTAMMKSQLLTAKACGEMIEFFIFDPMPKSQEGKERHKMIVKTYCELLSPYAVANRAILYANSEFSYKNYSEYLKRAEKEGLDNILKELFDEITSVPEEDSDAWYMVWARVNHQYPKEMFGTPRYVKFERGMFPVAAMQEHVDRLAYGDSWMYVPFVNDQISHDATDRQIDLPYQEVVDTYLPLIDRDSLYDTFHKRKRARVDAMVAWSYYRKDFILLWFDILGKPIIEKCNKSASVLREALESGDYKTVRTGIRDFMDVQSRPLLKTYGLMLPVSDEFLSVVIDFNVRTGHYYKMSGIVKIRRDSGNDIPGFLQASFDEFDYSRALSVAVYDDRDPEKVEALIGEHPEYKDRLDSARAGLWIRSKRACSDENYRALLDEAREMEQNYPEDGEVKRFTALAMYKLGMEDEAREKYKEAVKHTRNGFVWHEAEENCGIDAYKLMGSADESGEEHVERDPDNMKFRMRRLKELLFEIDDICRANDLKYSIAQRFAICMEEENALPDEFNNICIVMTLGDLERLEHIVNDEGDGSRVVENIHNNPHAWNLSARYVDTGTTLINFDDYHRHEYHGLFIDIRPIKQFVPDKPVSPGLNIAKSLWMSCERDRDRKRGAVKQFAVDMSRRLLTDKGITEGYYQADRKAGLIDNWEDIEKAPAVRCGAWSVRKEDYETVSHFKDRDIKRSWEIQDRESDGHPVMYCNQFYYRHVRGGVHGQIWVLENEMLCPEPYSELITGTVEKKLDHVRKLRNKYEKIARPIENDTEIIDNAWNTYLMSKDVLLLDRDADEEFCGKVEEALKAKDKEEFVTLMENYFTFLINYRNTGCPVIQIPKLRKYIAEAIDIFYPGMKVPASSLERSDADKLIVPYSFIYIDETSQMARLVKAAATGEWDLKAREDRKEGEAPFVRSDLGAQFSGGSKAAQYIEKNK